MVTHNQATFVSEAMKAIFRQSYSNKFQLVVSDDASTDGTDVIIRQLARSAPRHINMTILTSRNRVGALRNFNRALRRCEGQFIVIADGDDVSVDDRLETLRGAIAQGARSLYVSEVEVLGTGKRRLGISQFTRNQLDRSSVVSGNKNWPILGAAFAFDSSILGRGSGVDSFYATNHNADHVLFWSAMARDGCQAIARPLVHYRDHGVGISLRRAEELTFDAGQWAASFDFHLKRVCNRIGNLAFAADQFLKVGEVKAWRCMRDKALDEALALVETLSSLGSKDAGTICPVLSAIQQWACEGLDKILAATGRDQSFASAFDSRDMLLWAAFSEGGLIETNSLQSIIACRGMPRIESVAFRRMLLELRSELSAQPKPILSDSHQFRLVLMPSIRDDLIYYRGRVFPLSLKSVQALPKRAFFQAAKMISSSHLDAKHADQVTSSLLSGQIGKRRAFALLAGGRFSALSLTQLTVLDRLKIAFAPSRLRS